MSDICEHSDLPVAQCDHCAHGIPKRARRQGVVLAHIVARYGGLCSACGDGFAEGEPIVLTTTSEGFWIHEGCA